MLDKHFAGLGSRKTPEKFQNLMSAITFVLMTYYGYHYRGGRAKRADQYFENGIPNGMKERSEVYLPKKNFEKGTFKGKDVFVTEMMSILNSNYIIEKYNLHEDWENIKNSSGESFSLSAHIRNVFQILGPLKDDEKIPVKFMICWTPDAAKSIQECSKVTTGGTQTAIKLCCNLDIPVYNLANKGDLIKLYNFVSKHNHPFKVPDIEELLR